MRLRRALTGTLAALTLTLATTGIASADNGQTNNPLKDPLVANQILDSPSDDDAPGSSDSFFQPFSNIIFPESDGSNSICTNTLTGKKTVISMSRAYQCYGWVDLRNAQNKNVGRVYGYHLPAPGSKSGISCRLISSATFLFGLYGPGGAALGTATRTALATLGLTGIATCR